MIMASATKQAKHARNFKESLLNDQEIKEWLIKDIAPDNKIALQCLICTETKVQPLTEMDDGFVVRLRGLPWSATPDEIINFFGGTVRIVHDGVHFTSSREGRPSGEAFVQLETEEDVKVALERHMDHMGSRYIEVFRSKQSEMDWVVKRSGRNTTPSTVESVLRLRGLPFGCSKEEIAQFFTGLEIVPNGIMIPEDRHGRTSGEAYVQFSNQDCAERALTKHKERIGHRYIEIFKSSLGEATRVMQMNVGPMGMQKPKPLMQGMARPGPYDRSERFMGSAGGMGGGAAGMGMGFGGYGKGRGRNLKGFYEDDYEDDMGFGDGGMGGMGMNRRGNVRQQQRMPMRMPATDVGNRSGQPGSEYHSKTGHSVHMRGLPFQAQDSDIRDFFAPLYPVNIEFDYHENRRFSGEVDVDFATHKEAVEAMKKHKTNMHHRYIELFLNSTPVGHSDGYNDGMDYNNDPDMGMRKGNMGGGGGYTGGMDGSYGMSGAMNRNRMNNPNYTAF